VAAARPVALQPRLADGGDAVVQAHAEQRPHVAHDDRIGMKEQNPAHVRQILGQVEPSEREVVEVTPPIVVRGREDQSALVDVPLERLPRMQQH